MKLTDIKNLIIRNGFSDLLQIHGQQLQMIYLKLIFLIAVLLKSDFIDLQRDTIINDV